VLAGVAALASCSPAGAGRADYDPPVLHYDVDQYWATGVVEVSPGAGQHANASGYALVAANYDKVLGPPDGSGTAGGNADSVVCLHGPGAYIVVRFNPPIENHAENIGGYDFIVFGNAYWNGGNPEGSHWQEPAYIEVMRDENGNGIPDDAWYLIPGSEFTSFPVSSTTVESRRDEAGYYPAYIAWDTDETHPDWYPGTELFPDQGDSVSATFYTIDSAKAGTTSEWIWGYLDVTPTLKLGDMSGADGSGDNSLDDAEDYPPDECLSMKAEYFYTVPDTHGDHVIDPGSGGGDAVDIAWAVNPETGELANLTQVDFIRITNCSMKIEGVLGDVDSELDAIARVRRE